MVNVFVYIFWPCKRAEIQSILCNHQHHYFWLSLTPILPLYLAVFCQIAMACTVHFFGFCGCKGNCKVDTIVRICLEYQSIFLRALSILFLCYTFESQEFYSLYSKTGVFRRVIGLSGSIFASMENHCSSWKKGQVPLRMFSFVACCL